MILEFPHFHCNPSLIPSMIDKIINLNSDDYPEIDAEGTKIWRNKIGQLHRENGPAIIWSDGQKEYCLNDLLHREDGPAVIHPSGIVEYWVNGERHRTDGPAVIDPRGFEEYCQNNKWHRLDGPAIIRPNGKEEYWEYGERIK